MHKINDSKEYLAAFTSKYKKMELRLEVYSKTHEEMEKTIGYVPPLLPGEFAHIVHACSSAQRRQIGILEGRQLMYEKQKEALKKAATLEKHSRSPMEFRRLEQVNEKLREENLELREQVEESNAMVDILRAQVQNRPGAMSPRIQAIP